MTDQSYSDFIGRRFSILKSCGGFFVRHVGTLKGIVKGRFWELSHTHVASGPTPLFEESPHVAEQRRFIGIKHRQEARDLVDVEDGNVVYLCLLESSDENG